MENFFFNSFEVSNEETAPAPSNQEKPKFSQIQRSASIADLNDQFAKSPPMKKIYEDLLLDECMAILDSDVGFPMKFQIQFFENFCLFSTSHG